MEQPTAEQRDEIVNDDQQFKLYVMETLGELKTTLNALDKTVRGNGVPGLVQRVDDLESTNDRAKGARATKNRWMAAAMTVMVALLGASVSLAVVHDQREDAQKDALSIYMQKQDSRIQSVEVQVAVLMAGLRGAPGPKGPHGAPGPKGDKGGVKLFGK